MMLRVLGLVMLSVTAAFSQVPPIAPGVSLELAKWRAEHYSDVRYKLNLTLEKMSPVLKGTIEIRVTIGEGTLLSPSPQRGEITPIILDWRKIAGYEKDSTISNVTLNGTSMQAAGLVSPSNRDGYFEELNEHLIFRRGMLAGDNVIKLDFTSPILTSGSAITRYVDKEDGAEYIYSLFAPSDASTAFPVFDQPDLKARFEVIVDAPKDWEIVTNTDEGILWEGKTGSIVGLPTFKGVGHVFGQTQPISTYVFSFAAGSLRTFTEKDVAQATAELVKEGKVHDGFMLDRDIRIKTGPRVYVRKSQAAKFEPQALEVFRLTREAVKYLETYFGSKSPFPKYDLVLIPEFPLGVADGAGVAFLRESSVVLPPKPTTNETAARALAILHATARQWTGEKAMSEQLEQQWLRKVLPDLQPEQAR